MKIHHITLLSAALAITTACQNKPSVPKEFQYAKDSLAIFPDYKDIIIPSNIAPLNFQVKNNAKRILVEICADNKTKVVEANNNQELHSVGTGLERTGERRTWKGNQLPHLCRNRKRMDALPGL